VPHTGRIKAMEVTKNSSSYWQADATKASLQRVYGIAFPDAKALKAYKYKIEEAKKRDHRVVGVQQELFFFDAISPGSCFFLPRGAAIYNKLISLMRSEYRKRGFQEVVSPNMYNKSLWETSGHWQNYAENMFSFEVEHQTFGLKPMNCPGHCVMFGHKMRSYRELPLRMADFGVLHRNELSGALTGLTRVRRFQQDDAHIFCRTDQIASELEGCLDFLNFVYNHVFGFKYELNLSTRPEKFLGKIEVWDDAEAKLTGALNHLKAATGQEWHLNPGDGAFYGPKIDIKVEDALGRKHQCATIQLDFQLPIRFNLQFQTNQEEGKEAFESPVIIHRAILGSVERMIAILMEHTGGKWPFWLSPRQVKIVPVAKDYNEYANKVGTCINEAGFSVEVDDSDRKLDKKIREAQLEQFNYILVVGKEEAEQGTVNVRTRDNKRHGTKSIEQLLQEFRQLELNFTKDSAISEPKDGEPAEAE